MLLWWRKPRSRDLASLAVALSLAAPLAWRIAAKKGDTMTRNTLEAWQIHAIEKDKRAARRERSRMYVEIRESCRTCKGSGCAQCGKRGTICAEAL